MMQIANAGFNLATDVVYFAGL